MRKVYLLGACRTPIGKMGGELSSVSAVDLGALVIREAVRRSGVDSVDHVYMGCVLQAALGQNAARQASIKAGLPFTTTAETLNIVCGSGLDAVNSAARLIQAGDADVVVAGGMESMSNAPYALKKARFGYRMGNGELVDTMVRDGLWEAFNNYHMGVTAENVAEKWNLTREELDCFSAESQRKAVQAIRNGRFNDEIVPVAVRAKHDNITVSVDEAPRPGTTVESLRRLRPAFKENGLVTAGNSSGINDGAAAVVVVSEEKAKQLGLTPMAEWLGGAMAGVDPAFMGIAPVASTRKLLTKLNISLEKIDLIEANEAFAAQSVAVAKELRFDMKKVNVNGGAIALGHPIGASGCRILVTLLHEMKRRRSDLGLATLCIGGGMGCSTVVRRVESA